VYDNVCRRVQKSGDAGTKKTPRSTSKGWATKPGGMFAPTTGQVFEYGRVYLLLFSDFALSSSQSNKGMFR